MSDFRNPGGIKRMDSNRMTFSHSILNLGKGEDYKYLIQDITEKADRIRSAYPKAKLMIGVDIIATKDQISEESAQDIARKALIFIDENHSPIARAIGITHQRKIMPIRDIVLTKKIQEDIIDDVNYFVFD